MIGVTRSTNLCLGDTLNTPMTRVTRETNLCWDDTLNKPLCGWQAKQTLVMILPLYSMVLCFYISSILWFCEFLIFFNLKELTYFYVVIHRLKIGCVFLVKLNMIQFFVVLKRHNYSLFYNTSYYYYYYYLYYYYYYYYYSALPCLLIRIAMNLFI